MERVANAPAPKPIRSPSYPSWGLNEAIAQVRKTEAAYRVSQVATEKQRPS